MNKDERWLGVVSRSFGDRFFINKLKKFPKTLMNAEIDKFNHPKFQLEHLAKVWYEKGEQLANSGKYVEALTCFNKALAIQPQDNAAWVFKAVVLIHLNRYQEALASCEQALEIQPTDKQAWLFRGAALNHLGRYKQSYASYDKALGIERQSVGQKLSKMLKGILRLGKSSGATFVIRNSTQL